MSASQTSPTPASRRPVTGSIIGLSSTGIPKFNPPMVKPPFEDNPFNGAIYPSYVPKVDSDGNDIAGIRLPELTVPLATYTGWGLRSGVWANDGCEASGQYIPFQAPRRSALPRAIRGHRSRNVSPPSPCNYFNPAC